MEHVDRNRIHNYIYRYGIQDTEENFNKIGEVIKQEFFIFFQKFCILLIIAE